MIIATHSIFSAYGFWLPNDPRGSWSNFVASWDIFRYGAATRPDTRESLAGIPHNHQQRLAAKQSLRFPAVEFTDRQIEIIGEGFQRACDQSGYRIFACAIMTSHVHMVIKRDATDIRRIVGHFKGNATLAIKRSLSDHSFRGPIWSEHGWNVYLDTEEDVERAIRYVEDNPVKEGGQCSDGSS